MARRNLLLLLAYSPPQLATMLGSALSRDGGCSGLAHDAVRAAALLMLLLQSVLTRLPLGARARARVVCRTWNAALAEPLG